MQADVKDEIVVRCPKCGRFALRGQFDRVETLCGNHHCRATFEATVKDGRVTVTVLRSKKA